MARTGRDVVNDARDRLGWTHTQTYSAAGVSKTAYFKALRDPSSASKSVVAALERALRLGDGELRACGTVPPLPRIRSAGRVSVRALIAAKAKVENVAQDTLLETTGVSRSSVYAFLRGQAKLTERSFAALAECLGCTLEELAAASAADDFGPGCAHPPASAAHPFAAARKKAVMSRRHAATLAGVGQSVVAGFEKGRRISPRSAKALADVFPGNAEVAAAARQACGRVAAGGSVLRAAVADACMRDGLSAAGAAKVIGISRQHLSMLLSGAITRPAPSVICNLAAFTGLDAQTVESTLLSQPTPHAASGRTWRHLRAVNHLSAAAVGDLIGVHPNVLSLWETGRAPVPAVKAAALRHLYEAGVRRPLTLAG